jgi:hypothetical protein
MVSVFQSGVLAAQAHRDLRALPLLLRRTGPAALRFEPLVISAISRSMTF